jgi:hypothetical protein
MKMVVIVMNKKMIIGIILTLIIISGLIGGGLGLVFSDSLKNPFIEGKIDRAKFKE